VCASTWWTPISKESGPASYQGQGQLRVGRLTKAHGLKGGIKVEMYTDAPERRFLPGSRFYLQVPADSAWHGKTLELVELKWFNGSAVGFFAGVDDRSAAEGLLKAILWIDEDPADYQEDDAWYDHQLIGLAVQRDGVAVGTVARVEHMPAQDLLAVSTPSGEVLVPFVKALVPSVDLAARIVTVTPPAGLFEELPDPDALGAEAPDAAAGESDAGDSNAS